MSRNQYIIYTLADVGGDLALIFFDDDAFVPPVAREMSSPREALPPAPLPALASSAPTHYGQNARSWVYALGGTVRVARVPAVETQRARIRRLQPLWNDSLWPPGAHHGVELFERERPQRRRRPSRLSAHEPFERRLNDDPKARGCRPSDCT